MNTFFYNLGKRTANVIDATISGTSNVAGSVGDAATSFVQGLQEQTVANSKPSTKGYEVTELSV